MFKVTLYVKSKVFRNFCGATVSAQREDSSRRIVAHDKYDRRKTRIWKIADQII